MATTQHLRPSSAFYARFRFHAATRPNAVWTTYSSPQTSSDEHVLLCRDQWSQQDCCDAGPLLEHLDQGHTVGRASPATALDICDGYSIEKSTAPAPDVQEQPQHQLSSSILSAESPVHGVHIEGGIILYIKKKRETERAGARQRWFDAVCRGGEVVRVGGCARRYRKCFLKPNAVCMVTKLKVLEFFFGP